jgi:WD40 repeat protein
MKPSPLHPASLLSLLAVNVCSLGAQYHINIKRTLGETSHQVFQASYSPDGTYLSSAGSDNSIILWNTETGIIYRTLTGLKKRPNAAVFTSGNDFLLSAGEDNLVSLWDPAAMKIVHSFSGHQAAVKCLDLSPGDQYVASGGADNTIRIWQLKNKNLVYELKAHKKSVNGVAFSPDGRYLASGSADRSIILWSVQNGNIIARKEAHKGWIRAVEFSPDGNFLASCGDDKLIRIWDLPGFNLITTLTGHTDWVQCIAFSPNGKTLISGGHDQRIILWDTETGKMLHQSEKQGQIVLSVDIHPNRPDLVSAALLSEEIRIWALTVPDPSQWKGSQLYLAGNTNEMRPSNLTWSQPVFEKAPPDVKEGKYYALMIGINNYNDPLLPDLDNPITDAEKFARVLNENYTFPEENTIILRNPGRAEMMTALDDLSKKLTLNDNLLVFYAGHGYWDDKAQLGYWLPADAAKNSTVDWFRNSTLRDYVGSIPTRHTLVIADACFSGAIFKTRAAYTDAPKGIQKLYELPSRKAMTSGILQVVPDQSVFLQYLLQRLTENQDPFLASEYLFSSFKPAVMNNSQNVPQYGTIQNVGDEGGDFIFIRR